MFEVRDEAGVWPGSLCQDDGQGYDQKSSGMMLTFTGVLSVVLAAAPVPTDDTLYLLAVLVFHHRALSHGRCGGGGTLVGRGC